MFDFLQFAFFPKCRIFAGHKTIIFIWEMDLKEIPIV